MKDLNNLPIAQRMDLLKQTEGTLAGTDGPSLLRRQLLDRVASWYLFPGTQARPRVVGLWGMTGTGKTHFVRELVRQLRLEDRTFWMDGGQLVHSQDRANPLDRLAQRFDGIPYVLVVDEFQHACNKRNGMVRDDSAGLRMFWELVDSGRVMFQTNEADIPLLLDLRDELAIAIAGGMRVAHGHVVEGVDRWRAMIRRGNGLTAFEEKALKGQPWVFPQSDWKFLRDLMAGPLMSTNDLRRRLEVLDTNGVIAFVDNMIANCSVPRVLDARQGLVVVLGNLDELYSLGEEPLPELDPDVLLARHAELGLTGVQEALHGLFRIEQVARLGTDQFVFPPLGREALLQLGRTHVAATVARLEVALDVSILVDDALVRHLVEHHSIAVLGARPLLNAIERCIPDLVSRCQRHVQEGGGTMDRILLQLDGDEALASVSPDQERIRLPLPISPRIPMGRKPFLERVAVHEAGHAVLGMAVFGRCPLQVCAHTSSSEKRGFAIWPRMEETMIMLKRDVVQRMAVMLGGWAAERMRFGADGVSDGSGSDIAKATALAVDAVKERGLGVRPAFHAQHAGMPGDVLRIGLEECDLLVRTWLDEAVAQAEAILERERSLHSAVVIALCQVGSLNAAQMASHAAAHGTVALRGLALPQAKTKGRQARSPKRTSFLRRA